MLWPTLLLYGKVMHVHGRPLAILRNTVLHCNLYCIQFSTSSSDLPSKSLRLYSASTCSKVHYCCRCTREWRGKGEFICSEGGWESNLTSGINYIAWLRFTTLLPLLKNQPMEFHRLSAGPSLKYHSSFGFKFWCFHKTVWNVISGQYSNLARVRKCILIG